MKILITSSYNKGATLNRVIGYINSLSPRHEVECILPASEVALNLPGNAKYFFVDHTASLSKNFLVRYWQEMRFGLRCLKIQRERNADLEIVTVPYISLIITSLLRKRRSVKVLDVRDLVWEYLNHGLLMKVVRFVLRTVHVHYINGYDHLIATNDHEIEWLKAHTKLKKPILVNNGILQEQFDRIKQLRHKPAGRPIRIVYMGNVGIAQNLISFIKAVQGETAIQFVIVGDGNDLERIRNFVAENKVDNIQLVGRVPQNEIYRYYEQADILYAKLDENFATAVPSKLYEYLATNKPVIYSGKGAAIDLLKNFDNVYICNDDVPSIATLIKSLVERGVSDSKVNQDRVEAYYIREKIISKRLQAIIPE